MQQLRWGILGTANIARKNWEAIRNTGNSVVTAVASRDLKRSRQFVEECQSEVPFPRPPQAMGSYEELLASTEVDAVYIPLPTGLRKPWVLRAAQAGKHVLCEKPCATRLEELQEMIGACRQHNVQFMDGVMFMHSRRLERMRAVLDDGQSVGAIRRIATAFSFRGPEEFLQTNIRVHSELEPFGCLGDLGWYNIRLILWAMNWAMPKEVTGRILASAGRDDSPGGVPTEFSGELFFDGNVSATFFCSFLAAHQQWAHISGERGHLHVPDFVLPFYGCEIGFDVGGAVFRVEGCQFNMEPHARRIAVDEYSNNTPDAQECRLFRTFADRVLSRKLDTFWPEIALKTQQVMEACLASASGK